MSIYIPYTYLIGWSKHNIYYYGRRTAKNCHPNDFWKTYFTSSKYVKNFRKENGEPDIIKIRKIFPNNPNACKLWESKVLEKIDAQNNTKLLNKKNGDSKWDTTGLVTVKNNNGEIFSISVNDPRYISGELVHIHKGMFTALTPDNKYIKISTNDLNFLAGIYKHPLKGRVSVIDEYGKTFSTKLDDPQYISGKIKSVTKETVVVKDNIGNYFRVSKNDPRYISGELVHNHTGMVSVKDLEGNKLYVSKDDPRYISGELKSSGFGKKFSRKTILCINKNGEVRSILKEHFYSQIDDGHNKEWVTTNSNEGRKRKIIY